MTRGNFTTRAGLLLAAAGVILPGIVAALPEDRNQPIQVESDRAVRNEKDGTMVYIGNVELTQGSLLMRADRLEIFNNAKKDVERVIVYGKPAYVEQRPSADKPLIKARANTIRYFVIDEKLILEKNASVDQDGSVVTSDTIVYFIKDEVVQANSEGQQNQRVKVVIPPRQDNKQP